MIRRQYNTTLVGLSHEAIGYGKDLSMCCFRSCRNKERAEKIMSESGGEDLSKVSIYRADKKLKMKLEAKYWEVIMDTLFEAQHYEIMFKLQDQLCKKKMEWRVVE